MWLANKNKIAFICLLCFCSFAFKADTAAWSETLKAKVDKAVASVYETEALRYLEVEINDELELQTASKMKGNFFKLFTNDKFEGYLFVSQAPSLKNVFDYMIIFDENLEITKTKVLIYREQHGRQIGSSRWLNQFTGMTIDSRPKLGQEVDGISGATVSAKGMTKAVNDLLSSLSVLKSQGAI